MKVILTQEVTGLGGAGEVVDVKPGYARNYLLPRDYAVAWTKGGQKQVDQITAARKSRSARDESHAGEIKTKLEAQPVDIKVQAGETGRLFGSVTVADIADALGEATGESIDKRTVVIGKPIKSLGAHQVSVKLHDDVSAEVALNVIPS
jgi:large subunit ribosomal protein L9